MVKNSRKIAVIGTHHVGKTTLCKRLANYLEERGHSVGLMGEIVRDCPFPVNEMATLQAQEWILDQQKKKESHLAKKHDFVVLDRGLIDNFAYWSRVAKKSGLDLDSIQKKEKEVFEYSRKYDAILFLQPFDGNLKNDNFRSVDPEWRKEMHERVFEIMERFKLDHDVPVFLLEGNEQEVFERAKKVLNDSFV